MHDFFLNLLNFLYLFKNLKNFNLLKFIATKNGIVYFSLIFFVVVGSGTWGGLKIRIQDPQH
jgi:hypothetical protein